MSKSKTLDVYYKTRHVGTLAEMGQEVLILRISNRYMCF